MLERYNGSTAKAGVIISKFMSCAVEYIHIETAHYKFTIIIIIIIILCMYFHPRILVAGAS